MNQRIRELMNEATSFKEGLIEGKHDIELFDKEKFAELIVRECMNIVENHPIDPEDMPYNMRIIPYMIEVQEKMKLHFGVEE